MKNSVSSVSFVGEKSVYSVGGRIIWDNGKIAVIENWHQKLLIYEDLS